MITHPHPANATYPADSIGIKPPSQVVRSADFCDAVRMPMMLAEIAMSSGRGNSTGSANTASSLPAGAAEVTHASAAPDSTLEERNRHWLHQIAAAHSAWSRLSFEDLLLADGQISKLELLIQERYAISREDAAKRIKHFLDKQ